MMKGTAGIRSSRSGTPTRHSLPPGLSTCTYSAHGRSTVTVLRRKSQVLVYAFKAPGCPVATKSLAPNCFASAALVGDEENAMT